MITPQPLLDNQSYYMGSIAANWTGAVGGNSPQEVAATKAYIERIFCNTNVIKSCINRYVDSMVSTAPFVELKAVGKVKKALVDVSQADMNTLIISLNQMAGLMSDKSTNLIRDWTLKALIEGRAWLRLFLPKMYRNNANPFMRISAEVVSDSSVEVERDEEGSPISLIHTISNSNQKLTRWERQILDPDTGVLTIESYSNQKSLEDRKPDASTTLDLQNNWALVPLTFDSPITDTVRRLQDNIGMLLTLSNRIAVTAGFAERYILNSSPIGEEVKQADGSYAFEPTPNAAITLGASTVNYITGLPTGVQSEGLTNPSIYIKEPSSPKPLLDQLEVIVQSLYGEFSQLHVLSGKDGTISSQSRMQMRVDFANRVADFSKTLEPALGSFYKSALMLFGIVSGNPNYAAFDVVADLQTTAVVLLPEEKAEIRQSFLDLVIPQEQALIELGYDNALELIAKVEDEQHQKTFSSAYTPLPRPTLTDISIES